MIAQAKTENSLDRLESAAILPGVERESARPYQVAGSAWLASRQAALLCDEPGLGKTRQALDAAAREPCSGPPTFVVAPASVLSVWEGEAEKWHSGQWRVTRQESRRDFRWPAHGELRLASYDLIRVVAGSCPPAPPGIRLVLDEAHRAKTARARQARAARRLAEAARKAGGASWLLTGTPLHREPPDLWALMVLAGLQRDVWPGGWSEFVRDFSGKLSPRYIGGGRRIMTWEWGQPSPEVPAKLANVMLRRTKRDVATEIPPKVRSEVPCGRLDPEALALADKAIKALHRAGMEPEDLLSAAAQCDAFRAALADGGLEVGDLARLRRLLALAKLPAAMEVLDDLEAAGPVVAWTWHVEAARRLGCRPGWESVTGQEPMSLRASRFASLADGALRGIACTIAAAGTGLNALACASQCVFVERSWVPGDNLQAEDRLHRLGQAGECVSIVDLVADHPLERRLWAALRRREAAIEGSVEAAARIGVMA